jgi:hypothetical protein
MFGIINSDMRLINTLLLICIISLGITYCEINNAFSGYFLVLFWIIFLTLSSLIFKNLILKDKK